MDHCHRPPVTYTFTLLIIFLSRGIHRDHVVITSVINMVIKCDMIVKITSLIKLGKYFWLRQEPKKC